MVPTPQERKIELTRKETNVYSTSYISNSKGKMTQVSGAVIINAETFKFMNQLISDIGMKQKSGWFEFRHYSSITQKRVGILSI